MAAVILARKLARDEIAHRGAGPAVGIISLHEFDALFSRFAIKTAIACHDDRN